MYSHNTTLLCRTFFGGTPGCLFCKFTIFRSRIIINKVDLILKKYLNISIMKTKTKKKQQKNTHFTVRVNIINTTN